MRSRGGISVVVAGLMLAVTSGCAAAPGDAPTSMPSPEASATAEMSAEEVAAQQTAETWLETTPVPPGAVRSQESTSEAFAMSYQGWVCTPTMTETGYWTVEGMSPAEAVNWMLEHPTPGLVSTRSGPIPVDDDSYDNVMAGATPEGESLQGIAFTYVKTPEGTAIRAEVGATPADAVCPTPPGGGTWGRPGEG